MDLNVIKAKLKNKQDLTFLSLGILMSVLVFVFIFYAIGFLTSEIGSVLNNEKTTATTPVKFNLDQIKALEIEKTQK